VRVFATFDEEKLYCFCHRHDDCSTHERVDRSGVYPGRFRLNKCCVVRDHLVTEATRKTCVSKAVRQTKTLTSLSSSPPPDCLFSAGSVIATQRSSTTPLPRRFSSSVCFGGLLPPELAPSCRTNEQNNRNISPAAKWGATNGRAEEGGASTRC